MKEILIKSFPFKYAKFSKVILLNICLLEKRNVKKCEMKF
jgi:hypothetical protein